eukprot:804701-Prymnesium_polylepis.1
MRDSHLSPLTRPDTPCVTCGPAPLHTAAPGVAGARADQQCSCRSPHLSCGQCPRGGPIRGSVRAAPLVFCRAAPLRRPPLCCTALSDFGCPHASHYSPCSIFHKRSSPGDAPSGGISVRSDAWRAPPNCGSCARGDAPSCRPWLLAPGLMGASGTERDVRCRGAGRRAARAPLTGRALPSFPKVRGPAPPPADALIAAAERARSPRARPLPPALDTSATIWAASVTGGSGTCRSASDAELERCAPAARVG